MQRLEITYEQVAAAAENLTAKGIPLTLQRIGEHLGGGSPHAIQRHLAEWRAKQPPAKRPAPKLPDTLLAALTDELQRQTQAAHSEADQAIQEARSDATALAELGEGLEARAEQLARRLSVAEEALERAKAERDGLRTERDELEHELEHERQTHQKVREQGIKAQQQVEMLTAQLEEARQARLVAERATQTAQTALTKAERSQAVAEVQRDAALEQARDRARQVEQHRQALQAEQTRQRKEIDDLRAGQKARLEDVERARKEAMEQAQKATQRASKAEIRAEALEATLAALKSRLDALQVQQRQQSVGSKKAGAPRQGS
ncbi:hypothetical protein HOP52_17770 [Halomonas campisalis]|uniref:KfrA N-terminal DNA-binding domain-containing protein n=1 Tax=Billgrantia campisalis TaxID=74661 RepID=A0ABS9PED0_9GAMM|nr:DNA-binding protein [Halomonas campisalis]MCG6659602.1 hypothetical protein [Halomonas campisalis]MDR5864563.1 DNA-binding protein [Halomonas campisalis]